MRGPIYFSYSIPLLLMNWWCKEILKLSNWVSLILYFEDNWPCCNVTNLSQGIYDHCCDLNSHIFATISSIYQTSQCSQNVYQAASFPSVLFEAYCLLGIKSLPKPIQYHNVVSTHSANMNDLYMAPNMVIIVTAAAPVTELIALSLSKTELTPVAPFTYTD